ncbi:aldehyde dehydrogenase [Ancylobacter oerskovii]|uniref:Aldehyde dehydrogenase n=1 Tax=Ancylobacter oerskovii TaxID=459519 RepID=A0ABW4Z1Q2_9HYPH|nr:aldehyde dehydrogenase [Ancylobacter oerskovii]MBS7544883.1 aldehyde dehydrogenase [Ancylobacter oerskovii]
MPDITDELAPHLLERFHIGGDWIPGHSGRHATVVHPATEGTVFHAALADTDDMDRAIAAARHAFDNGPWPHMDGAERARLMTRLADGLAQRSELLARLATAQVGMPISLAENLVRTGLARYHYYAQLAASYAFEDRRPTARGHARVRREPVGVAALVSPWNATFPITAHKVGAALAAGCTMVVKSPVESPVEGLILAECAAEAGLPRGVINVVTADRPESAYLVASPDIDKISFTGSVAAGRMIGLGAADRMARTTLELGGKSAAIILDDADLSAALPALAPFTMLFSGQICFSQTRILAPRSRFDEVVDAYAGIVRKLRLGDPWDRQTQIGPVVNARQRDRILGFIDEGVSEGARVVLGGGRPDGFDRGFFVEPTVFVDVQPQMTIAREEIFGPVVTVHAYDDEDEAIRLANDSDLGLSGSVYSRDGERAYRLARRIRTGQVGINGVELAPSVPFGGFKSSGLGREGGPEGLEAFLETKAIFMPAAA